MYNRKILELTTRETELVVYAIEFLIQEGVSNKGEIAKLRKISNSIIKTTRKSGLKVLADIQLVPRKP